MRNSFATLILLASVTACTDYHVFDPSDLTGVGEAPTLATPKKVDVVVQQMPDKVDILWVIDNSGSMSQEQEKVATQFEAFAQYFIGSGLNWHMGVITTDSDDGLQNGILQKIAGMRYLTADTPHPVELFEQLVRVGVGGSSEERGLQTMWNTVLLASPMHQQENAGFLRDDASLHIVVIADEDDQSDRSTSEYGSMLKDLKPDPDTLVTFNSIVGPRHGCRGGGGDAAEGARYMAVTTFVGGLTYSICEDDWSYVLDALGAAAAGLREEYYLSELPVPGTVEVLVEDRKHKSHGVDIATVADDTPIEDACTADAPDDCFYFAYDAQRNSIRTIDWMPGPKARVSITYELLRAQQPIAADDTDAP